MRKQAIAAVLAISLTGCAVGPNYKRPQVAVPDTFRGVPAGNSRAGFACGHEVGCLVRR